MDRTEWLEKRRKCITGTDIAAIVGLSKYGSPMSVYLDKLGLSADIVENEPMKWGKALEPVIAQRWADERGFEIKQGEFLTKGIYGGTPDYIAPNTLLEVKTAGHYSAKFWGEPGSDSVPDSYMCQVQWYLMLLGLEYAELAALIGGQDYRVYKINRNEKLLETLKRAADRFWANHIEKKEAPQVDGTESSSEYLKQFFPKNTTNRIIAAPYQLRDDIEHLHKIKRQIKDLSEIENSLENRIKAIIGDNDGIQDNSCKITWKSAKDSTKTNWELIAMEMGAPNDLIQRYTETRPGSRRFIFNYFDGGE
jgi:putative phage-type endonuclease